MKFTSLTLANFLSFGAKPVSLPLHKQGLVLIEGRNGSGKSSIPEALLWCLYGTTLRGYTADDVVHNKTGQDCLVTVTFTDGKHEYQVSRFRKHTVGKNALELLIDGEQVTEASATATQERIEHLLGMSAQTFTNTVVFGQNVAYRFSALTDKEQKAVLDQALGIEQYERAYQVAREEHNKAQSELNSLVRQINDYGVRIQNAENRIKALREKETTFEETKALRIEKARATYREIKEDVKTLIDILFKPTGPDVEERDTSALEKSVLSLQVTLENLIARTTEAHKRRERVQKLGSACDVCGQPLSVVACKDRVAFLYELIKDLEQKTNATQAELTEQQRLLTAAQVENESIKHAARRRIEDEKRLATLKVEKTHALEAWTRIKDEKGPNAEWIEKTKEEAESTRRALKKVAAKKEALEQDVVKHAFWVEAFGPKGLRSLLIDHVLPFLNEQASEYASLLSDGNLTIEFKTQSLLKSGKIVDKFEVAVENKRGADSYAGNSAGEKAKIDLCVGLSLQALVASRATSRVNVAFFDEVFESLDDDASERVLDLFASLATKRDSLFVITHNEAYKTCFPNVLTVSKRDGMSYVE